MSCIYLLNRGGRVKNMKSAKGTTKGSPLILIVEDKADWVRIISRACEGAGFAVRTASTFPKAVALLNAHLFDALVADIRLKDWQEGNVEGLEVLSAVPEDRRPATVVLSAYADYDNTRLAFTAFKVVDVLRKSSFDSNNLVVKLKQAIRATRQKRYRENL
jgi:CheY-like chemotaxis protein